MLVAHGRRAPSHQCGSFSCFFRLELNHDTDTRDGQDVEPSLLLVPVSTNPQIIPRENDLDGPRFNLHGGIVRFRLGQYREAIDRQVGPYYLYRVLCSLRVRRVT